MQTLTNYEDIVKEMLFYFPESGYGKKFWNWLSIRALALPKQ
jgi:hypothetical protein